MNLTVISSIAEIVASIAVVVTLIFIARDFRANALQTKIDSMARAIGTQVRQFAALTNEPEKAELLRHALVDFAGLTQSQKGQISTMIHDILLSHNVIRHAYQSGQLSNTEFSALQRNWLSLMRTTGGRQWWQGWKHMMPEDLVLYVNSALDDNTIDIKPLNEEMPWLYGLPSTQVIESNNVQCKEDDQ